MPAPTTTISRAQAASRLLRAAPRSGLAAHLTARGEPERLHQDDFDAEVKRFPGEVSRGETSAVELIRAHLRAPPLWEAREQLEEIAPAASSSAT